LCVLLMGALCLNYVFLHVLLMDLLAHFPVYTYVQPMEARVCLDVKINAAPSLFAKMAVGALLTPTFA
jgi:hypothetical protein